MADKPQTPKPPRQVQAPKVRAGGHAPGPSLASRVNVKVAAAVAAVLVIGGVVGGVLASQGSSKSSSSSSGPKLGTPVGDMTKLPGILLSKPPWPANSANAAVLRTRLETVGIPALGQEALAYHIHQHLDIFVDGKKVSVPQYIGIGISGGFITTLHTHDTTGVLHVESPTDYPYTLGQFFEVWGVRFSKACIGGVCPSGGLKIYVDGKVFSGDPTAILLTSPQHQEIVVVAGTPPATIPSRYSFPQGE